MQLHSGKVCIQVFIKKQNDLLFEQCRILPCGKTFCVSVSSCSIVSSIFQHLPKKPGRRSFCRAISKASSLEGGLSAGIIVSGLSAIMRIRPSPSRINAITSTDGSPSRTAFSPVCSLFDLMSLLSQSSRHLPFLFEGFLIRYFLHCSLFHLF